jgi:Trk K+ transport system NAD-binding subunit
VTERRWSRSAVDLRTRIRYRFDNVLARGTWAVLVWLGAVTVGAVLVSSSLLAVFRITFSGSAENSFVEDFWQSLLRTVDPGTMASDVGWGPRLIALTVTIFGILVAGTLIGLIANGVEQRVEAMRRGRSPVVESGHVVILGASRRVPHVVGQLALANRGRRSNVIVVLADTEPVQLAEQTRTAAGDLHGSRLVVRHGSPTSAADLGLVRLPEARAVIALRDGAAAGDGEVVTAVLASAAVLGGFDRIPIVAEVGDTHVAESLGRASDGAVHTAVALQSAARIAVFALGEPGLDQVVMALLDDRGSSIFLRPVEQLAGVTFGACVFRFDGARPIGLVTAGGAVSVNPDPSTRLGAGDELIVLADRRAPTPLPTPFRAVPSPVTWPATLHAAGRVEHVVIVGWSALGGHIVGSVDEVAAPGSSVEIVYDPAQVASDEIELPTLTSVDVTVRARAGSAGSLDDVGSSRTTTVVLLAQRAGAAPAETDSHTLLAHLMLRRALQARPGPDPSILVELLDADNAELVRMTDPNDRVISDALTSRLLVQLAEEPRRRAILLQIYAPGGPSLRLVPVRDLGVVGDVSCGDIIAAAYAAGLLALGWRTGAELRLNAPVSDRVTLGGDDHIVVVG